MQKKRAVWFVLVTFALSWAIGFFAIAQGITLDGLMGADHLEIGQLAGMGALSLYMWMPALGSVLVRFLTGQGFREMKLAPHPRKNWKNDLLGWFAPFGFALTGTFTYFLFFSDRFDDFAYLKAILHSVLGVPLDEVPTFALAVLLLLAAALTVPCVSLVSGPLGEELGWRGYLYPTLCGWLPRWKAMLLTGVVWGIWHTPLLIMGWDYGTAYAGYPVGGIVVMTLCTVCMGAFQCWLTDRSGNIWPSVLAHGALNVAFSFYLLGNNFCKGAYHPLLGVHPLTLLGGWTLIAAGWVILVKTRSGWPEH